MKRFVHSIIWHCFDTKTNQNFGVKDVEKWHIERGFSEIGYHKVIRLDGTVEDGRDLDKMGAHCLGVNKDTLGFAFEGGLNPDGSPWFAPTDKQMKAAKELVYEMEVEYQKTFNHFGHYQFSKTKSCPNFDICILTDYLK